MSVSPTNPQLERTSRVDLTVAEPCFPIRVAPGHVQWLLREGVDYVFVMTI